jgi:anaerobic magnesium-protoporphyrin IX monomethyl ester cyclase
LKVLLVKPVTPSQHILNCLPPLGLGYLAAALRESGFSEVKILDCVKEGLDYQAFTKAVRKFKPGVVGFQIFSQDLPSLEKSLSLVKKINPRVITLAGGPHPSVLPKETLDAFEKLDFLFCGEAEIGLPIFLKALKTRKGFSKIPGLGWRDRAGRIRVNPQTCPIDLEKLGLPAWDLIDPREYPDAPQGVVFRASPVAPIMATRGCPFSCTFCAGWTISGKKIRRRSVDHVLKEIELLHRQYGVREVHFLDDNFTLDRDYLKNFCQRLIKSGLGISWCCPNGVRLDTLNKRVVKLMKRAGCYYVSVGIESGTERILKLMKKGTTPNKIKKEVKMVNQAKMPINGFFILGYPGETREEILKTIQFAKDLGLTRAAFYNFLPLPRTEAYQQLIKSGEIKPEEIDWAHIFQADVPYSPGGVSRKQLKNLQRKAHLEFYLRPLILWQLLKEIKSLQQFKYILKRAKAYLLK